MAVNGKEKKNKCSKNCSFCYSFAAAGGQHRNGKWKPKENDRKKIMTMKDDLKEYEVKSNEVD